MWHARLRRSNQLLCGSLLVLSICWLATPACTLSDPAGTPKGEAGSATSGNAGAGADETGGESTSGGTGTVDVGGSSNGGTTLAGSSSSAGTNSAGGAPTTDGGAAGDAGAGGVAATCGDTQADPDNCGSCGRACPAPSLAGAQASCTAGKCGAACPPGTLGDGVRACIPITTLTAGVGFTCGLRNDGHVECWGSPDLELNPNGLGNVLFKSLSAGDNFMCGIRDNGLIYCWGTGKPAAPSGTFYAIAAGSTHVCGIKSDLTLACSDYLDNGTGSPPSGSFKLIASGQDFSCAAIQGGTEDGRATCWGTGVGSSGFPTGTDAKPFTQLWGGGITVWGVHPDGAFDSWGIVRFPPPSDTLFKTIAAGGSQNRCGILTDSSLLCWGIPNSDVTLAPSGTFKAVAMGGSHACAVKSNGSVICWGGNESGQAPASVSGPFQGYW